MVALLSLIAHAGLVSEVPDDADVVRLLLCDEIETCIADARWLTALEGEDAPPFLMTDVLLELDRALWEEGGPPPERFAAAMERLRAAESPRDALAAADEAEAALSAWDGAPSHADLFAMHLLRGQAQIASGRASEPAFRQAAAIGWPHAPELPELDDEARHAYTEALRKLVTAGTGVLSLARRAEDASSWFVDGVEVEAGSTEVEVLAGTHRVTVVDERAVRTFRADVPALPGRTVTVQVRGERRDDAMWIRDRLHGAFETLHAPDSVTDVLADWCARHGVERLGLLEVDHVERFQRPTPTQLSEADPLRPDAAAGEAVQDAWGLAGTWEDEVLAAHDERRMDARPEPVRRLRVLWFDPVTRRFETDPQPPVALGDAQPARLRIGLHAGYAAWRGHHHLFADVVGTWPLGPVDLELRLGLMRADSPYRLYPDWHDRQLYHVLVGASGTRGPVYAVAAAEAYAPATLGVRLEGGIQAEVERWTLRAGPSLSVLDKGISGGIGVGLVR